VDEILKLARIKRINLLVFKYEKGLLGMEEESGDAEKSAWFFKNGRYHSYFSYISESQLVKAIDPKRGNKDFEFVVQKVSKKEKYQRKDGK